MQRKKMVYSYWSTDCPCCVFITVLAEDLVVSWWRKVRIPSFVGFCTISVLGFAGPNSESGLRSGHLIRNAQEETLGMTEPKRNSKERMGRLYLKQWSKLWVYTLISCRRSSTLFNSKLDFGQEHDRSFHRLILIRHPYRPFQRGTVLITLF